MRNRHSSLLCQYCIVFSFTLGYMNMVDCRTTVTTIEVTPIARVSNPPHRDENSQLQPAYTVRIRRMGFIQSNGLVNKMPFKCAKSLANQVKTSATQT